MIDFIGMSVARAEAAGGEASSVFAVDSAYLIILAVIALIIALVVVINMRAKLRTATHEDAAENYVRSGSFKLSVKQDKFMYETVSRTKIEKQDGKK